MRSLLLSAALLTGLAAATPAAAAPTFDRDGLVHTAQYAGQYAGRYTGQYTAQYHDGYGHRGSYGRGHGGYDREDGYRHHQRWRRPHHYRQYRDYGHRWGH